MGINYRINRLNRINNFFQTPQWTLQDKDPKVLDAVVSDAAEHLAHLNIQKELAATHLKGWIRLSHMSQMIMTCRSLYMLILLIRLDPLSKNIVTYCDIWICLAVFGIRRAATERADGNDFAPMCCVR